MKQYLACKSVLSSVNLYHMQRAIFHSHSHTFLHTGLNVLLIALMLNVCCAGGVGQNAHESHDCQIVSVDEQ